MFEFALSVTAPIFIVVFVGALLRRGGLIDDGFVASASQLVFKVALPTLLFLSLYRADFQALSEITPLLAAAASVLLSFFLLIIFSRVFAGSSAERAVLVQGGFRGNLGVVGLAFCANAFGPEGLSLAALPMAVMTIIYNVLAVMILPPVGGAQGRSILSVLHNSLRNPLIIALMLGASCNYLGLRLPHLLEQSGDYFSRMTLPLALLCIGASMDLKLLRNNAVASAFSVFWKLLITPAIAVGVAWLFQVQGRDLVILFLLSSTPTAAASYVMVQAADGDTRLAANIIVLSTLLSIVSVTLGLMLLDMMPGALT